MKLRSFLFFLSALLLVVSFVVVLVVIKLVVVPHLLQQAHVATVCEVTRIMYQPTPSPCVMVTVTYVDINGRVNNGYLRAKEDERDDYFSKYPQCFCDDCIDRSSPVISPNMHRSLLHHGKTISVGYTTSCYFKTLTPPSQLPAAAMHPGSYSTHVTMHAILWPTMAFVAGFVATFFSLIYVCRDWDMAFSDMDFCIYVTGVVET